MKNGKRLDSLVVGGGLLLQQGLGFISGIFVAKLLGPEKYGEFSVLRGVLQLIIVVSPLGLDLAIYRILPKFDAAPLLKGSHFRRFRIIVLLSGLIMILVGGSLLGPALARWVYGYHDFALHFAITLLAIPFATDLLLFASFYRVEGRVIPIILITYYFQPLVRTGSNILAVFLGYGVLGVVVGTTGAYVAAFLAAMLLWRFGKHSRLGGGEDRRLPGWGESWKLFLDAPAMALNLFAYNVMRTADLIIVGAIAPAVDVGNYAVVSNISQLVPVAAISLSQTLGPAIARHYQAGDSAGIQREMNTYIRSASILSGFIFGGVAAFGTHLNVIFGDKYHPNLVVIALIPFGYLISAVLGPTGYALTMCGKAKTELAIIGAGAALLAVSCVAFTHLFGTAGAAIAVVLAFAIGDGARMLAVNRSLSITLGRLGDLLPPIIAFAMATAIDRMLLPEKPSFLALAAGGVLYAACYGASMGTPYGWRRMNGKR